LAPLSHFKPKKGWQRKKFKLNADIGLFYEAIKDVSHETGREINERTIQTIF
jgi:hypothetical protein